MFGRKQKLSGYDAGSEIVQNVNSICDAYLELRVVPLQDALIEKFRELLSGAVTANGHYAAAIRSEYAALCEAWNYEVRAMKAEILDFRELNAWLDAAEFAGAREMLLDWIDEKFSDCFDHLRILAKSVIGELVLESGAGEV